METETDRAGYNDRVELAVSGKVRVTKQSDVGLMQNSTCAIFGLVVVEDAAKYLHPCIHFK